MNKKLLLFLLAAIGLYSTLTAQNNSKSNYFDNFTGIYSKGQIPPDFTMGLKEKTSEDHSRHIDEKEKNSVKRDKKKFIMQTNYYIDQMLKGGRVLYNDTLSAYVNKVANEVLKAKPELKSSLRFYVIKSPYVNAICTDKGIVLVNIGLLAQLENEAQLAYILSHEIVHYMKKHNMDEFLEEIDIKKQKGKYADSRSAEDKLFAKSNYSKEKESEADMEGLNTLYSKTNYDLGSVNGVFDVLQYSYLPFDEVPFEKSFFENSLRKIDSTYFLKDVNAITDDQNWSDSLSSHPNILKRRSQAKAAVEKLSRQGGQKFIVSKDEFLFVRNAARFELVKLYLMKANYHYALYSSYLLLKQFPDNKFLKKSVVASLYGVFKHKLNDYGYHILPDYEKMEGNTQQVVHLFKKISNKELGALTLDYAWELYKKDTSDYYLKRIVDDVMWDITYELELKVSDFYTAEEAFEKLSGEKKPAVVAKKEEDEEDNKYNKIRKKTIKVEDAEEKKRKEKDENESDKYRFYLTMSMQDDLYKKRFEKFEQHAKERKEENNKQSRKLKPFKGETSTSSYYYGFANDMSYKDRKKVYRNGYSLGIEKVILYKPDFLTMSLSKKSSINMDKADEQRKDFNEKINTCLDESGLEASIIDPHSFRQSDMDKLNDLSIISEWYEEELNTKPRMITFGSANLSKVCKKNHTNFINMTGMIGFQQKREYNAGYCMLSFIMLPSFPFYLAWQLSKENNTYYYNRLYDAEKNLWMVSVDEIIGSKIRPSLVKSHLYDSFHQIKNEPKKK